MKAAKIYLEAARRIADLREWGACDQINQVAVGDPLWQTKYADRFEELFRPEHSNECYWGDLWADEPGDCPHRDADNCRILALCFMAAISASRD